MNRKVIFPGLLVLSIAVAAWPIFLGNFFTTGDMATVYVPLESFFQQQQLADKLPAWNADTAWGFPTIAAAQTGFFYPPLLLARFLPLAIYFPLMWLMHVIAAGIGLYLFMRRQGATEAGSFLAATAFALSAFVWQHATHLNIILTLAWLPWQFLAVDLAARQARLRARHLALLVFSIGLPFLAGQIQIPALLSIVTSCYWLYRNWQNKRPWRTSIAALVLLAVLSVGLSAAQLTPTLELAKQSDRGVGDDFEIAQANQHSFPLYHLPTALFPRFFGSDNTYWGKRLEIEYGLFIGTTALLLALYASRRVAGQRFFISLLVVSVLLALGDLSPFRALGFEPSLWYFTGPARWLLFTSFAAAILAGRGFDQLATEARPFSRFALISGLVVIGAVIAVNVVIWNLPATFTTDVYQSLSERAPHVVEGRPADYYTAKLDQLVQSVRGNSVSLTSAYTVLPLALLALIPWLVRSANGRKTLLAIATAELIIIASTTSPTSPLAKLLEPPAVLMALPTTVFDQHVRVMSLLNTEDTDSGALLTNPGSRVSREEEARLRELLFPLAEAQFGIPGAAWPASLSLAGHTAARRGMLIETPTLFIDVARRNIGALVVDGELPIGEPIASLPELDATVYEVDTARAVLRDQLPNETASYEYIDHNHALVRTSSERAATLVVRDSYYPGWQATVDGEPAAITRADDIFRGIELPPGEHTVSLSYEPRLLQSGLLVSILTTIVLLGMMVFRRSSFKQPPHTVS